MQKDDAPYDKAVAAEVKALYSVLKVAEGKIHLELLFTFPLPPDLVRKYEEIKDASFVKANLTYNPSRMWRLQKIAYAKKEMEDRPEKPVFEQSVQTCDSRVFDLTEEDLDVVPELSTFEFKLKDLNQTFTTVRSQLIERLEASHAIVLSYQGLTESCLNGFYDLSSFASKDSGKPVPPKVCEARAHDFSIFAYSGRTMRLSEIDDEYATLVDQFTALEASHSMQADQMAHEFQAQKIQLKRFIEGLFESLKAKDLQIDDLKGLATKTSEELLILRQNAQQMRASLRAKLKTSQMQKQTLMISLRTKESEKLQAQNQLRNSKNEAEPLQDQLNSLQNQLIFLQEKLRASEERFETSQGYLKASKEQLTISEDRLRASEAQLSTSLEQAAKLDELLKSSKGQVNDLNALVRTLEGERSQIETLNASLKIALEADKQKLISEKAGLERLLTESELKKSAIESQNELLQIKADNILREIELTKAQSRNEIDSLKENYERASLQLKAESQRIQESSAAETELLIKNHKNELELLKKTLQLEAEDQKKLYSSKLQRLTMELTEKEAELESQQQITNRLKAQLMRCQETLALTEAMQKDAEDRIAANKAFSPTRLKDRYEVSDMRSHIEALKVRENKLLELLNLLHSILSVTYTHHRPLHKDWSEAEKLLELGQDWEEWTELLLQVEFCAHVIPKLTSDNMWLVDRLAVYGQELSRIVSKESVSLSVQTMKPQNDQAIKKAWKDVRSTAEAFRSFEVARGKLIEKFKTSNL